MGWTVEAHGGSGLDGYYVGELHADEGLLLIEADIFPDTELHPKEWVVEISIFNEKRHVLATPDRGVKNRVGEVAGLLEKLVKDPEVVELLHTLEY